MSCRGLGLLLAALVCVFSVHLPPLQAQILPETPQAPQLRVRDGAPAEQVMMVNHRPYLPPTQADLWHAYLRDTYGAWGISTTTVRSLYGEARGRPSGWGQNFPGYSQRFGSATAVTAINGTVRYGMEEAFREDLRYIPCHGCSVKHKIENALLSEITARHEDDGHRVFSLTPTIADFSGPIIAHTIWYPGASESPLNGVIASRLVFATSIGTHMFRELVLERKHKDEREAR